MMILFTRLQPYPAHIPADITRTKESSRNLAYIFVNILKCGLQATRMHLFEWKHNIPRRRFSWVGFFISTSGLTDCFSSESLIFTVQDPSCHETAEDHPTPNGQKAETNCGLSQE